ncbi:hypothetical protein [Nonomuraea dietziae]|uniref:hypothetical protein n=1 Tax=Nonomuraea dietziae TaxID=65515 RepID=UPI0031CEF732
MKASVPEGGIASSGWSMRNTSAPLASTPTIVATTFSPKCHGLLLPSTPAQLTTYPWSPLATDDACSLSASGRICCGDGSSGVEEQPATRIRARAARIRLRGITLP